MICKICKYIMVLLAFTAPVITVRSYAQQSNGSPDGLYVVPDTDLAARNKQESTAHRAAETYLNSLDTAGQRMQREADQAEAVNKAIAARKKAHRPVASEGPGWLAAPRNIVERAWFVVLASLGLLISLAATGFLWWSRSQRATGPVAMLMPMKPRLSVGSASNVPASDRNRGSKRRAA